MHLLDPSIPKFMSETAAVRYMLLYYTGLLPFAHIYQDCASFPYMTRDYLRMKLIEAREKSWLYYPFIAMTLIGNYTLNGMLVHMSKRGIFTCYWVINDDDEFRKVLLYNREDGIMTDRPSAGVRILN